MRYITTTPRVLIEQGIWDLARETCATAYGQSVYETHPERLDEPIIITSAEAAQVGFTEPPWSRLKEWLPGAEVYRIWGIAAAVFLVLWTLGIGR